MIRTIIAATLLTTAAQAQSELPEVNPSQNLAFCGSQVATLAWFYEGVVNDGAPELQPELDGLIAMRTVFVGQVQNDGEETIELFKKMAKASVTDLASQMGGTEEQGAAALAHVNANVRGCADIYFEKREDTANEDGEAAKSEDN